MFLNLTADAPAMARSILLTGASGRVGMALSKRLDEICSEQDDLFVLQSKTPLPENLIRRPRTATVTSDTLEQRRYNLAIHLAAIADTNYCQKPENHRPAYLVNVGLTARVCGAAEKVILVSTDNVFKGEAGAPDYKESDETNPCNYYGETKAAAEQIILANGGAVIRIQTLLGAPNRIVDKTIAEIRGEPGKYYPLWNDIYSRPAHFEDLLAVMRAVAFGGRAGIYHVSCEGKPLSRSQMGNVVLKAYQQMGLPTNVTELASEQCSIPHFPRRLVLDTEKTQRQLGIEFTSVGDALARHVQEYLTQRW